MTTEEFRSSLILVVDDVDESRYSCGRFLTRAGFNISEARSGTEALRLVRRKPDLVILDINLPDMSGYEVCRRLKSDPTTARIPVLHLSASFVSSQDKTIGLEGGADGYLASPVDPSELVATVRALLRIHRAETEARHLSDQWQATFDALRDGVCLLDTEGRIQRFNKRFRELAPYPDPTDAPLEEVLPELKGAAMPHRKVFASRVREQVEIRRETRWIEMTVDPILSQTSGISGAVCVLSDITLRRQAEQQLRNSERVLERRVAERTSELETTVRFFEDFCYSITHDLRAPLRAMRSFAMILLDEHSVHLSKEGQDYAKRIAQAAGRFDELVQDLLEYGRLSHVEMPMERVDPSSVLEAAISRLGAEIDRTHAVVEVVRPLHPVWANCEVLTEITMELISNAIKFIPSDRSPQLRVWTALETDSVRLFIEDNGIGIDTAHMNRIFRVFERLHAHEPYSGTGIGLAIVKKGAERMDGQVGVISRLQKGSTFWVELRRPVD